MAPQKPDRPIAAIVFSDTGKVRLAKEHLPRDKDALELAIGRKFVGSLRHFAGVELTDLVHDEITDERRDLACKSGDDPIHIQVTEVVDPVQVRLGLQRDTYLECLSGEEVLSEFDGCVVTIGLAGHEPYLPQSGARRDAACEELRSHIRSLGKDIGSLDVGKRRTRQWTVAGVQLHCWCERRLPVESGATGLVQCGGGRSFLPGEARSFLTPTVEKKLHYQRPTEGGLWLLAYSSDILLHPTDDDVQQTAKLLDDRQHPFDRVWYFYPYQNKDLGHLVPVWPRV